MPMDADVGMQVSVPREEFCLENFLVRQEIPSSFCIVPTQRQMPVPAQDVFTRKREKTVPKVDCSSGRHEVRLARKRAACIASGHVDNAMKDSYVLPRNQFVTLFRIVSYFDIKPSKNVPRTTTHEHYLAYLPLSMADQV